MKRNTKEKISSAIVTGVITIVLAMFTAGFTSSRRSGAVEEKATNNEKAIERLDEEKAEKDVMEMTYDAVVELTKEVNELNKYVRESK